MIEERTYGVFLFFIFLRYFVVTGFAFLIFYIIFKKNFIKVKIQKLFPKRKDYQREIKYSLLTMIIFSFYAILVFRSPLSEYTLIYRDFTDFNILYFFFSVIAAILLHDTYFYWTHRLMHHKKLFKYFHLVHHKSTNPSPWAAYSFHPLEAVVEGGIIVVVTMILPIHPIAIGLFLLFMITFNVYGHLGFEIFPKWLLKTKFGAVFNTATNHNMHHHYFKGNYGLYLRFWDDIMGTTHPKYEEKLKELKDL